MRKAFLLLLAFTVGCNERPPEWGVSVFANDTLPVVIAVNVTGSLAIALQFDAFQMMPDKSLVMATPGRLIFQGGEGTATINTLRGGTVAVVPFSVPPDSSDALTSEGHVVKLERFGPERRVKLSVEKP